MSVPTAENGADSGAIGQSMAAVQQRTIRVLSAGQVLSGVAIAATVPAGALLADSIAEADAAAGFAQTSVVTGAALLALPLARLALSRGRRVSLSTGFGVGALGGLLVVGAAVARSLPLVYVGSVLLGGAQAAGYQARYAATDLAPEQQRGRALSWVLWAATIGAVLGPNLLDPSGAVAESWGLPRLAGPYVLALACLAGAGLVLAAGLRPDPYLLARQARNVGHPNGVPSLRDGVTHLRSEPMAVAGIAAIAIGHVVMVMVMVMTPVHMAHVDVTVSLIGLVISVHILGMYAFSPAVGWLVDRIGGRKVVGVGLAVLVVACVVSATVPADNIPAMGVGLLLLGLGWSCTLVAGSTLLVGAVAARERPAVQGVSDLTMNVAGALGGAVAGVVVMLTSYAVLCLAALGPIAAVVVFLRRRFAAADATAGAATADVSVTG
jgi:MFS family permease